MHITMDASLLPHDDPDVALGSNRDTLGFEVRLDVEGMRPTIAPGLERLGLLRRTEVRRNG